MWLPAIRCPEVPSLSRNILIFDVLLATSQPNCDVETIFLPALREKPR